MLLLLEPQEGIIRPFFWKNLSLKEIGVSKSLNVLAHALYYRDPRLAILRCKRAICAGFL